MSPLVIGFATIVAAIVIYRLVKLITGPSSPLPPGPRPWPIMGNLPQMGEKPHQTMANLAQKYGPLMYLRMGSNETVVACSASVAEQFLKVHDANFLSRPVNATNKHLCNNVPDLAFAPYGARFRLIRKASSTHMFSGKAMDGFRHVREEEVQRLTSNLASSGSNAVKLGEIVNLCATNSLARVMIGRRVFNDDKNNHDPKADEFKTKVMELMKLLGMFNISDFFPILDLLDPSGVKPKAKKIRDWYQAFLTTVFEENKVSKNSEKFQDLYLNALMALKDISHDGVTITEQEIRLIIMTMFGAGTDTTSSTIEWAIAELIKNPRILKKIQQELDSVVGQDRLVSELDLPQLPYFQAVIKETFRLHPPTPLSLPRISEESCEILGYHIPKKATLLVNVWAIGRDPKEWLDPLEFKPERFLPDNEKDGVDVKGNNYELIPFGAGRRICVGMNLGIKAVQLITATLVHAFDWDLENGLNPEKLNMDEVFGLTLQRAVPLSVIPRPRLSKQVYHSSLSSSE